MQYSAEFIILAPPFDRNFQITWQKITSWEKWILRIKPRNPVTLHIHSGLAYERPAWSKIITATSPENESYECNYGSMNPGWPPEAVLKALDLHLAHAHFEYLIPT